MLILAREAQSSVGFYVRWFAGVCGLIGKLHGKVWLGFEWVCSLLFEFRGGLISPWARPNEVGAGEEGTIESVSDGSCKCWIDATKWGLSLHTPTLGGNAKVFPKVRQIR